MAASHNMRSAASNIKTVAGEHEPIETLPSASSSRPLPPIPVEPKVPGGAHRHQRVVLKIKTASNNAQALTKGPLAKSQDTVEDVENNKKKLKPESTSVKITMSREQAHLMKQYAAEKKKIKREYQAKMASLDQQFVEKILRSHTAEIRAWKVQFLTDSETQGVSQAVVPARNQEVAAELLNKFKEFSTAQQGLVVAGMGVVTMALGCHSWPFLVWVWPRLIAFASRTEVASVAGWLFTMVQSTAFQDLIKAWQDGEPLRPALFSSFGPEIKSAMLAMATNFFTMYQTPAAATVN